MPFDGRPEGVIQCPHVDHWGLGITFLGEEEEEEEGPKIKPDPTALQNHVWTEDEYEGADFVRNIHFQSIKKECCHVSAHRLCHPNCSVFHKTELTKGENRLLGPVLNFDL
eukprot:CAMPEP_0197259254 /NCGR_PEP_ID=MMETSP1429-20130617/83423_1 /TAXON_ID=49237 /ORGANISM="Chaetoceros  sp., Strain UNC1202" /LENGTH=110 /DNA_ID=CAMNT_0042723457 /DNA_START=1031 /DNA_END=1363 /DNA_ORIENTATION=+